MTLKLGRYLKKQKRYGNLKRAASNEGQQSLKNTDYVMSHIGLLIF